MKPLSIAMVATSALLALPACDKKKEEGTQPPATGPVVKEPAKPEPPKPLVGAALADKYKACLVQLNTGKLDEFKADCLEPSYTSHAFAGNPEVKGADAVIGWMKDMRVAFPDLKFDPQLIVINGRNLFAVNLMTGTHQGPMKSPMGEVAATNKKIGLLMFHRLAISDANKASDEWAVLDAATMMSQLGLMPKEGPPKRPAMDKGMDGAPMVVVAADDAKEKANLEAFKKGDEAFNAKKPSELVATMADDILESDQTAPADVKGKKDVEKGMMMFMGAFSDAKLVGTSHWAAGDLVIGMGKFEGTNDGDIGPMKKTGKKVSLDYAEIAEIKDGKTTKVWRFFNGASFAEQLGKAPEKK